MINKWREKLYGYTGLFVIFGLWTPLLWFVSYSRAYYKMESFDILSMNWFSIFLFFVLCAATLVAQFGFILLVQDLSEFERTKKHKVQY